MPTYVLTNGRMVTGMCYAADEQQARRGLCIGKRTPLTVLPDRPEGWNFQDADLHLFPKPLAPLA